MAKKETLFVCKMHFQFVKQTRDKFKDVEIVKAAPFNCGLCG